jgi:hypothetical protein
MFMHIYRKKLKLKLGTVALVCNLSFWEVDICFKAKPGKKLATPSSQE